MKTREDIEKLKKSWLADPCWDIEDSEGFEEFKEELTAFHKEQDEKWEKKKLEREIARGEKVGHWMKIFDIDLAQVISTPDEIERELSSIDNNIGEAGTHFDLAQLVIAREQVRATILLMSQVKRIADLMGEKMDMVKLYKVD